MSALEVLAANGIHVMIDLHHGYTPTPVYAESFRDRAHPEQIQIEAQALVTRALAHASGAPSITRTPPDHA